MVTAELSQLSAECSTWRASLRQSREDLSSFSNKLQEIASKPLSKPVLQDIEHYQNQFRIQLLNVHNLKQAVKEHERVADWELQKESSNSSSVWSTHEDLYQKYQSLNLTLQSLADEFNQFASQVR